MPDESADMPEEKATGETKKKRDLRTDRNLSAQRRESFAAHVIDATLEAESAGRVLDWRDYEKCAMKAGYPKSTAKTMSYYLRRQPDVQEQIRTRLAAAGISDAEIIGFPASVIRYSLADCCDFLPDGSWRFNPFKALATGAISVIKSLGRDGKGNDKVELYDKLKASDQLASIRGLKRAEVKPDDLALRRMNIEDNIRHFREQMFIQFGDDARADDAARQYEEYLRTRPEYAPYMEPRDPNDRTHNDDPAS